MLLLPMSGPLPYARVASIPLTYHLSAYSALRKRMVPGTNPQNPPTITAPAWQAAAWSGNRAVIEVLLERECKLVVTTEGGQSIIPILLGTVHNTPTLQHGLRTLRCMLGSGCDCYDNMVNSGEMQPIEIPWISAARKWLEEAGTEQAEIGALLQTRQELLLDTLL